jgi:hypothetical protein
VFPFVGECDSGGLVAVLTVTSSNVPNTTFTVAAAEDALVPWHASGEVLFAGACAIGPARALSSTAGSAVATRGDCGGSGDDGSGSNEVVCSVKGR